jgi:hypothetical protein
MILNARIMGIFLTQGDMTPTVPFISAAVLFLRECNFAPENVSDD